MRKKQVIRVRDVMKEQFGTVQGMDTIKSALAKLLEIRAKCLVVEKRHDDDEYGILLVSDIARKVIARDRPPERVNVYEIMAKPVISVDPGMDIRYCARLFDRFDISHAPVIEGGRVVGLVSFSDLVLKGLVAATADQE
ncbi:MAG: CBS domain-containing protein [Gammaproteobacteria bacterium]|nr:CBS domain-containing protein [Gammaproteobacteria bacterium]